MLWWGQWHVLESWECIILVSYSKFVFGVELWNDTLLQKHDKFDVLNHISLTNRL